jgi:hypothetical protein
VWRLIWGIGLIAALLLISSTALASSPTQEDPPPDTETGPVPPLEPPEVIPPGEGEEMAPAAVQAVQAAPGALLNYQGYLTNAAGAPLSGAHDMTFHLFAGESGGVAVWGPELHAAVGVSKGLFQVVLGSLTPLNPSLFDQQLYLETTVGSTALPRQALHAAPYALSLVLGAEVEGSSSSETDYALSITNNGGRAIYANAKDNGRIAIYSADRVHSAEGYSGPDTVAWAPGNNLQVYAFDTSEGHIDQYGAGLARVSMDADNETVQVSLPVQIERPYGRAYRLTHVTLYYKVGAPSYIDEVQIEGRNYNTNAVVEEISAIDGASATYAQYNVVVDPPIEINASQAVSNIWLILKSGTPNGQNGYVDIFAARLTLDSSY